MFPLQISLISSVWGLPFTEVKIPVTVTFWQHVTESKKNSHNVTFCFYGTEIEELLNNRSG